MVDLWFTVTTKNAPITTSWLSCRCDVPLVEDDPLQTQAYLVLDRREEVRQES